MAAAWPASARFMAAALPASLLVAAFALGQAPARQPLVRPIVENDRVRVSEVVWEPGAGIAASKLSGDNTLGVAGIVIKGGTMEHTQADGKKVRRERRPGELLWEKANAVIEGRQNVGQTNINVIQVRLKKAPLTRAYSGPVGGAKKLLENQQVAVFEVSLPPRGKFPMHKYAPRVWVVLEGGRLRSVDNTGKPQEAGVGPSQVLSLPAQEHSIENTGGTTFRAVSLELK